MDGSIYSLLPSLPNIVLLCIPSPRILSWGKDVIIVCTLGMTYQRGGRIVFQQSEAVDQRREALIRKLQLDG
jgi:hypothetical protein